MAFISSNWEPIDSNLISRLGKFDSKLGKHVSKLADEKIPITGENVSDFKVYQRTRNLTGSSSISVAPFFKGDGNYDNFKFSYFIGAFSDRYRYTEGADSSILAERFGFGVEIDLTISNLKSSVRGGFGMIAAAAEMELASAEYEYHIRSLPPGDLAADLPEIGKFDRATVTKLKLLVDKLKKLYHAGIKKLDLSAIEVLVTSSIKEDGVEHAPSYYYAARRIIEGVNLRDAILRARELHGKYNEDAIQYVYSRVGVQSLQEKPGSGSINLARQLIFED